MVRIGANRRIPKLAKQAMQNPLTQNQLFSLITTKNLLVPFNQNFLEKFQSNQTSGFHFPFLKTSNDSEKIPFYVPRTPSGELPVYIKYKAGRTLPVTCVKQIVGDLDLVERELCSLTDQQVVRKTYGFEVRGNHVRLIKFWLRGIGF